MELTKFKNTQEKQEVHKPSMDELKRLREARNSDLRVLLLLVGCAVLFALMMERLFI